MRLAGILTIAVVLAAMPCLVACGGAAHARAREARAKANGNAVDIERMQRRLDQLEKRVQELEAGR